MMPLSAQRLADVLKLLGFDSTPEPTLDTLNRLIATYARKVPWESASRLARRAIITTDEECPRWPEIFWDEALRLGTGGTCFESNYAFFTVLQAIGYDGYLTINDMHDTIGCHTAIVLRLQGTLMLVDAGFPIYAALPLDPAHITETIRPQLSYRVQPLPDNRFALERFPHPAPYMFTLINSPVSDAAYQAATTRDYGVNGLFLNQLVVNKLVDEGLWRFASNEKPYRMECFQDGQRIDTPIETDPATEIHRKFGIDRVVIEAAFKALTP